MRNNNKSEQIYQKNSVAICRPKTSLGRPTSASQFDSECECLLINACSSFSSCAMLWYVFYAVGFPLIRQHDMAPSCNIGFLIFLFKCD